MRYRLHARRWLAAAAASACLGAQAGADTGVRSDPGTLARGKALFDMRCYFCHGYAGDARTAAARVLDPPPADLTALTGVAATLESIAHVIRDGRAGTAMIGFAVAFVVMHLTVTPYGWPLALALALVIAVGWNLLLTAVRPIMRRARPAGG